MVLAKPYSFIFVTEIACEKRSIPVLSSRYQRAWTFWAEAAKYSDAVTVAVGRNPGKGMTFS